MQGHFDLQMLETPGLTPELVAAWKKQGLDPIKELQKYEEVGRYKTDNLVLGTTASFFYFWVWSGATPYGLFQYGQNSLLYWLLLTSTSTEPSYTGEYYNADVVVSSLPDIVASNAYKQFISGCVTTEVASDAAGREAVYGNFKFLFYPGEATSSVIRSATVYHYSGQYSRHTRVARVRIKDSGGSPVTLNKTATRSLLIQYLFTLPTI